MANEGLSLFRRIKTFSQPPLPPLPETILWELTCEHCGLLSLMSRTKTSTGTEAWNLPSDAVILSRYLAMCSRSRVFLEEILHSSPTWLMLNWPRGSPSKKEGCSYQEPRTGMNWALCPRWLYPRFILRDYWGRQNFYPWIRDPQFYIESIFAKLGSLSWISSERSTL